MYREEEVKPKITHFNARISVCKLGTISIIGVYLPSENTKESELDITLDAIKEIIKDRQNESTRIMILGDFNADLTRLTTQKGKKRTRDDKAVAHKQNGYNDMQVKEFIDSMEQETRLIDYTFTQMVDNTYKLHDRTSWIDHVGIIGDDWTCIDQINIHLTPQELYELQQCPQTRKSVWDPLNNSDHRPIAIKLAITEPIEQHQESVPEEKIKIKKINWRNKEEIKLYRYEMEARLKLSIETDKSPEEELNSLHDVILESVKQVMKWKNSDESHKPEKIRRIESRRRKKWWNKEIDYAHKQKKCFYVRWRRTRDQRDLNLMKHYTKLFRKLQNIAVKEKETERVVNLTRKFENNINKFWQAYEGTSKTRLELELDNEKVVETYSETFNSKIIDQVDETALLEGHDRIIQGRERLRGEITVDIEVVRQIIQEMNTNRKPGLTGITNEMIKYGTEEFMNRIRRLLEKMVNTHTIPSALNTGLMFPIAKDAKGPKDSIDNARPITLSEAVAIILEKYFLHKISLCYRDEDFQFGFRQNYSTNHAIFVLKETVLYYIKRNKSVFICFLDFSKAFDKINRILLLEKLKDVLDFDHWYCLKKYYEDTAIIIKNGEYTSSRMSTRLGVKQGGPMSPRLFSIYINDMIKQIRSEAEICQMYGQKTGVILYADDTSIICPSEKSLQDTLVKIESYCSTHEIAINAKKTKFMILGPEAKNKKEVRIEINGSVIERVASFKFLGVWVDEKLSNVSHLKAKKAAALAASYKLTKHGLLNKAMSANLKAFLIRTFCRSKMVYGLENVSLTKKDTNDLKVVEGKILKRALSLSKYSSTTAVQQALGLGTTEDTLNLQRLKFFLRLLENAVTHAILNNQLKDAKNLPAKSLLNEILNTLNIKDRNGTTLDAIKLSVKNKISLIEVHSKEEENSTKSKNIKYLLNNRNSENEALLSTILDNFPDRITGLKSKSVRGEKKRA